MKQIIGKEDFNVKNPKSLIVYAKAMELNKEVYKLVKQFPIEDKYMMRSQILRSCTSIGANIAEGNVQIYKSKIKKYIFWLKIAIL